LHCEPSLLAVLWAVQEPPTQVFVRLTPRRFSPPRLWLATRENDRRRPKHACDQQAQQEVIGNVNGTRPAVRG
jgi:hypothetical protein